MNSREQFEQRFPVPDDVCFDGVKYKTKKWFNHSLVEADEYQGKWEAWHASRSDLTVRLPNWCFQGLTDKEEIIARLNEVGISVTGAD